jgi:hypothetical protein
VDRSHAHSGSAPFLEFPRGDINKTSLLRRGWTKAMIRRFLGPPDETRGFTTRRYQILRKDRPECLYSYVRVSDTESTPEFRAWKIRLERMRERRALRADGLPDRQPARNRRVIFEEAIPREYWDLYDALSARDQSIVKMTLVDGLPQRTVGKRTRVSQQTVSLVKKRFLDSLPKKNISRPVYNLPSLRW